MTTYRVVIVGIKAGQDAEEVVQQLATMFKQPVERLRALVTDSRTVVKRGADLALAAKMQAAIEAAGCEVVVEPEVSDETPTSADQSAQNLNTGVRSALKSDAPPVGLGTLTPSPSLGKSKIVRYGGGFILLCIALIAVAGIYAMFRPTLTQPEKASALSGAVPALVADGRRRSTVAGLVVDNEGSFEIQLPRPVTISGDADCGSNTQSVIGLWDQKSKISPYVGKTVSATGTLDCPRGGYVLRSIDFSIDARSISSPSTPPKTADSQGRSGNAASSIEALVGTWQCEDRRMSFGNDGRFHFVLNPSDVNGVPTVFRVSGRFALRESELEIFGERMFADPPMQVQGRVISGNDAFNKRSLDHIELKGSSMSMRRIGGTSPISDEWVNAPATEPIKTCSRVSSSPTPLAVISRPSHPPATLAAAYQAMEQHQNSCQAKGDIACIAVCEQAKNEYVKLGAKLSLNPQMPTPPQFQGIFDKLRVLCINQRR